MIVLNIIMPKSRTLNMYRQTKDSHYEAAEMEKKDYTSKIFNTYFKSNGEINKNRAFLLLSINLKIH